ncbi:hypothetical protein [Teredinibacter turnerae]|uniref:hypothetical protein n=1 Tax=Teredinibacter turnerae TaxID=2426 RepID=UPI000378FACE|nr:hypothetical protein [Teredinibacter turnerae]
MKISLKIVVAAIAIGSSTAFPYALACPFHQQYGYSSHSYGGFEKWRSAANTSLRAATTAAGTQWVELTLPPLVAANRNEKSEIKVAYTNANDVNDLEVQLEDIPEISIVNVEHVQSDSTAGFYIFTVVPVKGGILKLSVVAKASTTSGDKTLQKYLYLNAIEA